MVLARWTAGKRDGNGESGRGFRLRGALRGDRDASSRRFSADPCEPDAFLEVVERRLDAMPRRGTLAYVEVVGPYEADGFDPASSPSFEQDQAELSRQIGLAIGPDDMFCWYGGRFIILADRSADALGMLRRVSRLIASVELSSRGANVHLTPIIGYVDLRLAGSARELWEMAETAVGQAKSSLEIQPFRYVRQPKPRGQASLVPTPKDLWRKAPQWLVLSIQFLVSLVLGLGAPFVLYAVCDALGVDISGPVYIGVVIVLVITATTIWIEGLLALKATKPPEEPGSPYPVATIIIPAYLPNEAATIIETLHAFLRLDYANTVQIIVAYNCPSPHMPVEDELHLLASEQAAYGRFLIEPVRVDGSTSKAQNVNAVVGRVKGRFVGIYDADHHPHPDSLQRAWRWLSNGWDIVQGRCSIRNGMDSWVARMVAVEFEQIYAVSHPGRARFHGFGIFGGSNGFWRTPVLHETRMRHSMLTEDIDSSIRAVVAGYKITGDRDLVSEELAPTALKQLLNQRLRWAQGWFQVSLRRVIPALLSPRVTGRQKLGLLHLLVWRELFPWYSIQVVPIMAYWVWIYGWSYIHWTIPIFLATTIYTVSTGPGQIVIAYSLAQRRIKRRIGWFVWYLFVSTFFFSPFKDALSRIAHVKEFMRERAWKVTPRAVPSSAKPFRLAPVSIALLLFALVLPGSSRAEAAGGGTQRGVTTRIIATLLGGEASTINAARQAAREGRNAQAARLFEQAIAAVPGRRRELLREYADALTFSNRSADAVPLYRELLSFTRAGDQRQEIGSRLGLALTWSGQYRAALTVYDALVGRAPSDADLVIHRARVLAWLGRTDEAVSELDKVPSARWSAGPLGGLGDEILVEGARGKARAGQRVLAAALFTRAMQHNDRLRSSLIPEYTDQIASNQRSAAGAAPRPGDLIASYRASLARLSPGGSAFQQAQRGLALALAADNMPAKALDAWTVYLRYAPRDVDALLHRAALLSQLHQGSSAREAFQAAYAIDEHSKAARTGLVDETVALARAAAREDRNEDSKTLFELAIKADPDRRREFLREYADQVSFSGHAADAIPLYTEARGDPTLSVADRKQVMAGLANALAWADHPKDAAALYAELANAYPEDVGFQWSKLVMAARDAARTDRNSESVVLFEKAVALSPERSRAIIREYADQLTFVGRAQFAIPLYENVLGQASLTPRDGLAARVGLARAYEWSERLDDARSMYQALLAQNPSSVPFQWKLLVVSARKAAQDDKNRESAELFARAIKLNPEGSIGILREYADQLSFTERAGIAVEFYKVALTQPGLSPRELLMIKRDLARAYDWAGRYPEAKAAYVALATANLNDPTLRWDVFVVSAREAAANDHNKEAAQFFAQAIRLLPARRTLVLKEYADKLTYSGAPKLAVPLYRELLGQPLPAAKAREAALALALALAWDHRIDEALHEYEKLATSDPTDSEAALGAARMMSWSGRQSDAQTAYQRILASDPHNGEAQRGLAQSEDWNGHHRAAQALLTRRLQDAPNDIEARRLLAQSLVWSGRPDKALDEVRRALQYQQQQPSPHPTPGITRRPKVEVGLSTATPSAERTAFSSSQ